MEHERDEADVAARSILAMVEVGIEATQVAKDVTGRQVLSENAGMLVALNLWLRGPLRPGELARAVGMTTGGGTKLINRLQRAGIVTKVRTTGEDHRAVMVSLTDDGRHVLDAFVDAVYPVMSAFASKVAAMYPTGDANLP